jgi:hypothetical protein
VTDRSLRADQLAHARRTNPQTDDDLRSRIAEALNACPAQFIQDAPDGGDWFKDRPYRRHDQHRYDGGCAMCRGETDTLINAVLAVVQTERDRLAVDQFASSPGWLAADRDSWRMLANSANERAKRAEAERDRYRSAWQSARQRATAQQKLAVRARELAEMRKGRLHKYLDLTDADWHQQRDEILRLTDELAEAKQRAEKTDAEVARLAATLAEIDREHTALTRREIAVRDYCTLTLDSCRVQAREVAQDVLRLLDGDGKPSPKDTGQLRFIHNVLKLAQDGDFRSDRDLLAIGVPQQFGADVSDVFAWGGSDYEEITPDRLPVLAQAMADLRAIHRHDDMYTVDLYAARIRQMRPQGAAYPKERAATQALFDACGPARATGLGNPRRPPTPTEDGQP